MQTTTETVVFPNNNNTNTTDTTNTNSQVLSNNNNQIPQEILDVEEKQGEVKKELKRTLDDLCKDYQEIIETPINTCTTSFKEVALPKVSESVFEITNTMEDIIEFPVIQAMKKTMTLIEENKTEIDKTRIKTEENINTSKEDSKDQQNHIKDIKTWRDFLSKINFPTKEQLFWGGSLLSIAFLAWRYKDLIFGKSWFSSTGKLAETTVSTVSKIVDKISIDQNLKNATEVATGGPVVDTLPVLSPSPSLTLDTLIIAGTVAVSVVAICITVLVSKRMSLTLAAKMAQKVI